MVSKEVTKARLKVKAMQEAEGLANDGLVITDRELYEAYKKRTAVYTGIIIFEILVVLAVAYISGRADSASTCTDQLMTAQGLAKDAARAACKAVTGW